MENSEPLRPKSEHSTPHRLVYDEQRRVIYMHDESSSSSSSGSGSYSNVVAYHLPDLRYTLWYTDEQREAVIAISEQFVTEVEQLIGTACYSEAKTELGDVQADCDSNLLEQMKQLVEQTLDLFKQNLLETGGDGNSVRSSPQQSAMASGQAYTTFAKASQEAFQTNVESIFHIGPLYAQKCYVVLARQLHKCISERDRCRAVVRANPSKKRVTALTRDLRIKEELIKQLLYCVIYINNRCPLFADTAATHNFTALHAILRTLTSQADVDAIKNKVHFAFYAPSDRTPELMNALVIVAYQLNFLPDLCQFFELSDARNEPITSVQHFSLDQLVEFETVVALLCATMSDAQRITANLSHHGTEGSQHLKCIYYLLEQVRLPLNFVLPDLFRCFRQVKKQATGEYPLLYRHSSSPDSEEYEQVSGAFCIDSLHLEEVKQWIDHNPQKDVPVADRVESDPILLPDVHFASEGKAGSEKRAAQGNKSKSKAKLAGQLASQKRQLWQEAEDAVLSTGWTTLNELRNMLCFQSQRVLNNTDRSIAHKTVGFVLMAFAQRHLCRLEEADQAAERALDTDDSSARLETAFRLRQFLQIIKEMTVYDYAILTVGDHQEHCQIVHLLSQSLKTKLSLNVFDGAPLSNPPVLSDYLLKLRILYHWNRETTRVCIVPSTARSDTIHLHLSPRLLPEHSSQQPYTPSAKFAGVILPLSIVVLCPKMLQCSYRFYTVLPAATHDEFSSEERYRPLWRSFEVVADPSSQREPKAHQQLGSSLFDYQDELADAPQRRKGTALPELQSRRLIDQLTLQQQNELMVTREPFLLNKVLNMLDLGRKASIQLGKTSNTHILVDLAAPFASFIAVLMQSVIEGHLARLARMEDSDLQLFQRLVAATRLCLIDTTVLLSSVRILSDPDATATNDAHSSSRVVDVMDSMLKHHQYANFVPDLRLECVLQPHVLDAALASIVNISQPSVPARDINDDLEVLCTISVRMPRSICDAIFSLRCFAPRVEDFQEIYGTQLNQQVIDSTLRVLSNMRVFRLTIGTCRKMSGFIYLYHSRRQKDRQQQFLQHERREQAEKNSGTRLSMSKTALATYQRESIQTRLLDHIAVDALMFMAVYSHVLEGTLKDFTIAYLNRTAAQMKAANVATGAK